MPKIKLTQKIVDGLKGTEKLECWFDESTTGFGVYAKGNVKTYFVQARVNGKQVKATIGKANIFSLDDARKEAKAKLVEMSKGVNPNEEKRKEAAKGMTLGEATDLFFKAHKLKPSTEITYKELLRLYLSDWKDKPIRTITKEMVSQRHDAVANGERIYRNTRFVRKTKEEIEAELLSNPDKKPKMVKTVEVNESLARKGSANNLMKTLRAIYNFARAITDGNIPDNPVGRLSETNQWYKISRRRNIIKPHDLKLWYQEVNSLDNITARDFMLLLLFTGARREETITLKWEDVDFKGKTLIFKNTKNNQPHTLPLSDFLFKLLDNRKKLYYENKYIFPGRAKKGNMSPPLKPLRQVMNNTGIIFCFHDLRRTFITVAESLDIPYAALKRLLNHSMATDVTDGYLAISTDRLREPMEKISRRLLELMTGES